MLTLVARFLPAVLLVVGCLTVPLRAAEINRDVVTVFQWGVSNTVGLTIYIGGQSDTGSWVTIGYTGDASGITYSGGWQCYDSPLQRRVGSVVYTLPGANNFWGEIALGAVNSGYLQTRASVDAPWESTELNTVAPEFLQIFNEWETWRHHPGGGVILSAHPNSVFAWLDSWSYSEYSDRAVTVSTDVPVAFQASQSPSPSGGSISERLGVAQDTPGQLFPESLLHTIGYHNGIATQWLEWRSTDANDPQNPTRPFWTAGGSFVIQPSIPSNQVNVTPIALIQSPPHSFSYYTKDVPGVFNQNGSYSSGFYNSSVQLIPLASNLAGGQVPVAASAPAQATEKAQIWAEKFETWRQSGPSEAYFAAESSPWRVFFNGYVWNSPDQASFALPDCGKPVPVSFSGNHLFIEDRNGPQSPLNYTQSLGFRDDLTNIIFSLQADDTWYQGNVNIVFDPTPGNTLITWGTCGVNAYAMSTDPRIGSTAHLYTITPNAEVPATVQQSVTKLLTAYAAYLNDGGYDFFDFLATGYPCGSYPNLLSKVHDGESSDDPCEDCPEADPATPAQGSKIGAGKQDSAHSVEGSFIDNHTFTYRHEATDYDADPAASGCAPCGGGTSGMGALPGIPYQRFHRYHDADAPSSLGPGVFDNFDISLTFGWGGDPMSWQYPAAWVMDPRMRYRVEMADYFDGIYRDWNRSAIQDLTLFDASGAMAYGPENAATATLSNHIGHVFRFEVIDTQAGAEAAWAGRLVSITDRNGNAITCTYAFPRDATDAALGNDRGKLWQRSAITDAYGRSLTFTYRATPVAGRSVVERVDLPNGEHLIYAYVDGSTFNLEPLVGLTSVTYPNGDVSTFTSAPDAATQQVALSIADAGASGTHRNKTVFLSRPRFIAPTGEDLPQVPWRVRKVVNGEGEVIYQNEFQDLGDGYAATLLIAGGRCSRYVSRYGKTLRSEVATNYVDGIDPGDLTWELNETLALGAGDKVTLRTDILNRNRGFERSHPSGKPTRINYPDGSYETFTYNDFAQVLTHRDRLGRQSEMTYDANGNRLTRRVAIGTTAEALWSWTYNARGQVESETDPNNHTTDYVYFPAGHVWQHRLAQIIHPADDPSAEPGSEPTLRATETFTYDAAGRIRSSSDAEGRTTAYDYDERNRLETVSYDDSSLEITTYGSGIDANLVTARSNRNGNETTFAYDSAGRRTGTTQAAGTPVAITETCTYRPGTTLEEVCVRGGERTETAYDYRLRPVATTVFPRSDRSLITASVYDNAQRLTKRIDPFGRATYLVYDVNDRVVRTVQEAIPGALDGLNPATVPRLTVLNPAYVVEDLVYDAEGQVLARIDGRDIRHTSGYDGQGRVATTIRADAQRSGGIWTDLAEAQRTRFHYDGVGNLLRTEHPRSFRRVAGLWEAGTEGAFWTERTYTQRNLLATETQAAGLDAIGAVRLERSTRSWTYTRTGQIRSETDGRGYTTTRTYGVCCDRLKTVTDPLNFVIRTLDYDNYGNILAETDANNLTISRTFDARHRVKTVTNGADETTTLTYDDDLTDGIGLDATYPAAVVGLGLGAGADGAAVATTNAMGETGLQIVDGLGRAVRGIDTLGHATTATFDTMVGDLVETAMTDALGHTVRQRRDGLGQARTQVDAEGQVATAGFDATGNLIRTRDANGVGMDCIIDGLGRRTRCTDTRGDKTETFFDAHSNVIRTVDGLDKETILSFDAKDRRTSVTDRIQTQTTFFYDADNRLLRIVDAEGGETTYAYDERGLLVSETFPKGQKTGANQETLPNTDVRIYAYDAGRRLFSRLDQQGVLTTYGFDNANRLTSRSYPDGKNDGFTYDLAGRLLTATSAQYKNRVERSYDATGRIQEEWLIGLNASYLPGAWKVGYQFDDANRLTYLTYPDGSVVARTYTARNQLDTISWDGSPIVDRDYDAGGRLVTAALGNGLLESRTYATGDNLVETIRIPGVTDFTYTYDANKRKTAESNGVLTQYSQTFGYDDADRLTAWTQGPTTTQTWDLSPVGDWTRTTKNGVAEDRTHTPVHEVVGIDGVKLTYDKKGNLTRDTELRRYFWDEENRLKRALVPATVSPTTLDLDARYKYDALGRRVAKMVNGRVTRYLHAGAQVIQEEDGIAVEPPAVRVADGDPSEAAEEPVFDTILTGPGTIRLNFQPDQLANPPGFWADKGRAFGPRTNGLTYGWALATDASERKRRFAHPLPEFDTFIRVRPSADRANVWSISLPNGTYPVVVVAGDATSTKHTNHLNLNGQTLTDPDPWAEPGYEQGDFDGWATTVTVTSGTLSIQAAAGARNPTLCWVAIGPEGSALPADAQTRLDALIDRATTVTWESVPPTVERRRYVLGAYQDDLIAYAVENTRRYVHNDHRFSPGAIADTAGAVVERQVFDAFGTRAILDPSGIITRSRSAVANSRGLTGKVLDPETGLYDFEMRMYSANLGRFIGRDPILYVDGMNLYSGYFVPSGVDPFGLFDFQHHAEITMEILKQLGYAESSWVAGVTGNLLTDYRINDPVIAAQIGEDEIRRLEGLHFDNLKDLPAVKKKWEEIEKMMEDSVKCPCDPQKILMQWGEITHAIQDFYAHSNWAELSKAAGYTTETIPTYWDWQGGSTNLGQEPGVYTGNYPNKKGDPRSHDAMNHDNSQRPNFDLARAAAKRATLQAVQRLEELAKTHLPKDCLDKMKQGVGRAAHRYNLEMLEKMIVAGKATGHWDGGHEH